MIFPYHQNSPSLMAENFDVAKQIKGGKGEWAKWLAQPTVPASALSPSFLKRGQRRLTEHKQSPLPPPLECHSERSEESALKIETRFFVASGSSE